MNINAEFNFLALSTDIEQYNFNTVTSHIVRSFKNDNIKKSCTVFIIILLTYILNFIFLQCSKAEILTPHYEY